MAGKAGKSSKTSKTGDALSPLTLLSLATRVFLSGALVQWTFQLERASCECSRSWKRDYVRYSYIVDVVLRLMLYVLPVRPAPFLLAVVVFDVAQFGVLLSYANELERSECECSEGWKRTLAFVWPVIYFSFVAMILSFGLLVSAAFHSGAYDRKNMSLG